MARSKGKKTLLMSMVNLSLGVTYFFSSANFRSLPTDSQDILFDPRISNDPTFKKEAGFRLWGTGKSGVTIGYIDIINSDGKYDNIIKNAQFGPGWRSELSVVFDSKSWDARVVAASNLTVVKAEAIGEDTIRLTVDAARSLAKNISQLLYPNNTQVQSIRGRPRPASIGTPNWTLAVCQNTALQLYDIHFDDFFDTSTVNVNSRGVGANPATDWRISLNTTCFGFEYLINTAGGDPFTCNGGGATIVSTNLITSANGGDFTTWAGSPAAPNGWTYVGTFTAGTREFLNVSSAARLHNTAGGTFLAIRKSSITIPSGALLNLRFDVTAVTTGGKVEFRVLNSAGTTLLDVATINLDRVGHTSVILQPGANVGALFEVRIGLQVVDVTIDNLRLDTVTPTTDVDQAALWICNQVGLGANLDLTSWQSLPTNVGLTGVSKNVGIYCDTSTMCNTLLDALADSFAGSWYIDRLGNIKAIGLYDPQSSVLTPLSLSSHQILANQDIQVDTDLAPGLSVACGFNKNHKMMGDSDFAGSVSQSDREKYSAEYQLVTQPTTISLPNLYDFAVGAPPYPTVLSQMTLLSAGVLPNFITGLYANVRQFKTFPMSMSDDTYLTAEPGMLVSIDLARYGFDIVNHFLASIDGSFLSDVVNIKVWS